MRAVTLAARPGQFGCLSASQRPTASRPRTRIPIPTSPAVQRPPASRRRIRLAKSNVREQSARQSPLHPPPVTLPASLVPVRLSLRFAPSNARRETNASRTSNAPRPLRSGAITMQQSRQPPFNPTGWHACCNHWNAPCHFASDKDQVRIRLLRAVGRRRFSYASSAATRPYRPEEALSKKGVRELLQVGRAARRWQVLVGVRWERLQCRVAAFYFQRVSLPVQWWRAAGCPPAFRPRLPWWQPLVWRWLVLSGWQR